MTKRRIHIFLLCLGLPLCAAAQIPRQALEAGPRVRVHHFEWTAGASDSVLILPHPWILTGSLTVRDSHGRLTPYIDFHWDAVLPGLRFTPPPDSGRVFQIAYRYWPLSLARSHSLVQADTGSVSVLASRDTITIRSPALKSFMPWEDDRLEKSGSLFRGVSMGTGGMRLESGLRLQLSGEIAPGINLSAALSDQSTPIQPEGNTQTLQEIDKVYVELSTSRAKATLGDLVFDAGRYGLGAFQRKLQGVMGRVQWDHGEASVLAAASKGQFKSQAFMGQEGVQGPYQLTGPRGQREIIVLAGTERVYVDGVAMTRGEENDYTIDYASGQIQFTRKRLITADSRITVDFEYSDQQFQKSVVGGTAEARLWSDRLRLSTSLLREADDKNHPLDLDLDDAQRALLAAAGDEADSAGVSGGRYVGPGQGSYTAEVQDGDTVYVYQGAGEGDHVVRFSYAGTGQGDYVFQGYGIYRYRGPGQGDYVARYFLPLAQSRSLAVARADLDAGRGLTLQVEAGFSAEDQNLYSPLDDGDNGDHAIKGQIRLAPTKIGPLGKVGLAGTYRHVGEQFRFAGRVGEVEHGRKWGVAEGRDWGETVWEGNVLYQPLPQASFSFEQGRLTRPEGLTSNRRLAQVDWKTPRWPKFLFNEERIETNLQGQKGLWQRRQGQVTVGRWGVSATAGVKTEDREDAIPDSLNPGFRFTEWQGGLGWTRSGFKAGLEGLERRQRLRGDAGLGPESVARTQSVTLNWNRNPGLDLALLFTRRRVTDADPTTEALSTDLAEGRLRLAPGKRALEGNLNYRYASNRASEMVRDTIEVGEGLGNYRMDEALGELVPDLDGNLLVRQIQTGRFLPVNHLQLGGELRLTGSRRWDKGPLSSLGWLSTWRVERRDKERDFAAVNRRALSPQWGQDTTLVSGQILQQHDLEYRSTASKVQARLRVRQNSTENHQLVGEGEQRRQGLWQLWVRASLSRQWALELQADLSSDLRDYESALRSDRDIHVRSLETQWSYRPKRVLELGVDLALRRGEDAASNPVKASAVFVTPHVRWTVGRKGHLRAEYTWGRIQADGQTPALPYEMFSGDQPGTTQRWSAYFTYRLSGAVQASLNYRGRSEPWRAQLYQTGQIEVRAFF